MDNAENIKTKIITYRELKNRSYDLSGDDYGILSDYFNQNTRDALLSNQRVSSEDQPVLRIIYYNGKIVGRHMLMPTRVSINNNIVEVQTGGGHEVVGDYRGKGLGTKLVKECIFNNDYPIYIGQYYSTGALSILKKLGLTIFEIPQFIKIRKVGPLLQERGIKNVGVISNILDGLLKAYDLRNTIKTKKLQKLYEIKEEKIVPQWVNDFANSEERKYFEVHDREWFQWNLDNKFTCYPEDRNFFFSIYDSNRRPVGFFVTKERFEEHVEGHRWNSLRGTILEWGIDKKSSLTEADINLLALATFSSNVDRIITVISDTQDLRTIQKLGFIRHGNYQMSIRVREDFAKEIPEDFFDQANWRIRYGGCNTALV